MKETLILELDPGLQRGLKEVAAQKGVTVRQCCHSAKDRELDKDEVQGNGDPYSGLSDADRFEQLQKKYFGDRMLPGCGADFIREAREARDAQLAEIGRSP